MRLATRTAVFIVLFACPVLAAAADVAPDWELVSSTGETVRLSEEVKEQPTLLFFWATWCPYCKALMPHLQSIRLEHGDDIKILAINFREDGDPVAFIENAGYDFTVLPEGDAVAASYGIHATPGIIIVDSQQRVRFDLRELPKQEIRSGGEAVTSHKKRAAYRAPYWAAEIRKSIDSLLEGSSQ